MKRNRTILASFITGIVLAGFPLLAIARHSMIEEQDIKFSVPANITPRAGVENLDIWSDINRLKLEQLSGPDRFLRGQTIYVHFSMGPDTIAYPFAVTMQRPKNLDPNIFVIRGKVSGHMDKDLIVRYNFESFLPSSDIKQLVHAAPASPAFVELAINDQAIARLVSIEIDGQKFPYRTIVVGDALDGSTQ